MLAGFHGVTIVKLNNITEFNLTNTHSGSMFKLTQSYLHLFMSGYHVCLRVQNELLRAIFTTSQLHRCQSEVTQLGTSL